MNLDVFLTVLQGLPTTILLTLFSLAVGMVGGIPLLILRNSRWRILSVPTRLIIELIRGAPPIVWLFIIFFGLPQLGVRFDPLTAAIIGMGIISSTYLCEIYRGGLTAVHHGQYEASTALGMSWTSMMSRIVGPQVARISVPAIATYGIGLLKDSSIAFTIGVTEMMYFANTQSRQLADALGPFLVVAALYILLSLAAAWGARALETTLRKRVAR